MNRSGHQADHHALTVVMVDSHAAVERGGAVQCASLARALALRGHRVTCIFDGPPDQPLRGIWLELLQAAGVRVLRLGLRSFSGLRHLRQLLAEERPDILHTHKNRALFSAWLAGLGRRRPLWIANRGTVYPLSRSRTAHCIHRRHVACILAVSNAVRDALLADGILAEKIEVVYGSFDPRRFDPDVSGAAVRRSWGVSPGAPLVGLVGSLQTPKKGHAVLLEAAALLKEKYPGLRVVLVGEGDPERLKTRAAALGITDCVIFAGFTDDVPAALAAMDIVVCSSLRGEGLTGALREALAMGRPVISSDVAGNRELVIDHQTGLLVASGDPPALARAIGRMLEDGDLARGCALRGRARVLALCTEDNRADRVERIYRGRLAASLTHDI